MGQADPRSTKQLFREWRSGDAEAGNLMAQRFADWFYAVATARLGEARGAGPCRAACERFGAEVAQVRESRNLVPWAHGVISEEVARAGGRATDGDEANGYTGNQRPKALLTKCRNALPDEVRLLESCYAHGVSRQELDRLAEPFGGYPLGVLQARYRVKRWLRDQAQVPFEVAPEKPVLDRAPLPLYESGQMASDEEESNFEQWMVSDLDLCRDIAEFATFALALRGGLPQTVERASAAGHAHDDAPAANLSKGLAVGGGVAVLLTVGLTLLVIVVVGLLWYAY